MHLKTFLIAFAVFAAVQAAPELPARRDVLDDALKAVAKYLAESLQKFTDLKEGITSVITDLEVKVALATTDQAKNLHDKVAQAAEEAGKQGADVSECLSRESEIDEFISMLGKEAMQCMRNEKKTLNDLIEELQNHYLKTNTLLQDGIDAKAECEKLAPAAATKCKASAAARLGNLFGEVTIEGTYLEEKIVKAVVVAQAKVDYCIIDATSSYGMQARRIAQDILKCIADNM